ncbi:hypothetical protein [Bosea sp. TAB14]|uniref:hypothetical protein n=1 Tax=Bosea sp. TAB14 TaxID=3237481 RepID=UPI003F8E2672
MEKTDTPGNDHMQKLWIVECTVPTNGEICGHRYASNGSDFFQRKCPACQGGAPGPSIASPLNVLCVDVGSFKNIGWANDRSQLGNGYTIELELHRLGTLLKAGHRLAIGFEAPIWTPRRQDIKSVTASRGGVERKLGRAWSAGPGCTVLATCLAVMPWCLTKLREVTGPLDATIDLSRFAAGHGQLLIWEAFVSGAAKALSHHEDAALAVSEFISRYPSIVSDVPPEEAVNHAAIALHIAGFRVDPAEFGMPATVVCVASDPIPI